ncbi:MAG: class I SAM-dependent methyltransferase [Pseudomonadota bacterium]
MSYTFSGEGPGVQTPDGCSVSLYRDLPYMGELEEVIDQFRPGDAVLELGCGTGRLCALIAELGCETAGVDESPEMLACLPTQVRGVRAKIEDLALGQTFDTVLLASHLINHPDAQIRETFVRAARRHLGVGGRFLVQRHSVDWLESVEVGQVGRAGRCTVGVEAVVREVDAIHLTLRYGLDGRTWRQSFTTTSLREPDIEALLLRCGFVGMRWHGSQKLWVEAVACPCEPVVAT